MKHIKKGLPFLIALAVIVNLNAQTQTDFKVEISGSGNPVILIPGLISGGDVWAEMEEKLCIEFECHTITLPGFAGVAPQEESPYLENWKENLIQYIQEAKLEEVILIGHSMGGFLSLMIGIEDIPEVHKIIVVDALPFLPALSNPSAETGFKEENARLYMDSFKTFSKEDIYNARMMMAQGMTKDSTKWESITKWAIESDLKTEAYSVTEMMGIDLREAIAQIKIPVLVFGAYDENPVYPSYTAEIAKNAYLAQYESLPNLQFEHAVGSKHFIMYDQPVWMGQKILDFLSANNN